MAITWDTSQIDRALVRLANADLTAIPIAGGFTETGILAEEAPYLTGNLRRSLHPEESHSDHVETVEDQGNIITVEVGTNVEYAADTEFRSRRPGWAARGHALSEGPVQEDMAEAARQVIEQAARG